jgi:hypothetical protein
MSTVIDTMAARAQLQQARAALANAQRHRANDATLTELRATVARLSSQIRWAMEREQCEAC